MKDTKKVIIDLVENGFLAGTAEVELDRSDSIKQIAADASAKLNIAFDDLFDQFEEVLPEWQRKQRTRVKRLKIHLVEVKVCFEGQDSARRFNAAAKWRIVHRWACREFDISNDSCANLELHRETPDGPVINENKRIGFSKKSRKVWLVKPGAEPNG